MRIFTPEDPFLGVTFPIENPHGGHWRPGQAFLKPVARAMHTRIQFPRHFEVANAVGTVVGNVLVREEAEVLPWVEDQVQLGYYARAGGLQRCFESRPQALAFARSTIRPWPWREQRQPVQLHPRLTWMRWNYRATCCAWSRAPRENPGLNWQIGNKILFLSRPPGFVKPVRKSPHWRLPGTGSRSDPCDMDTPYTRRVIPALTRTLAQFIQGKWVT